MNKILNPKTIAVIGAKSDKGSVGWGLMKNVLSGTGNAKIFAINPNRKKVMGVPCLPSVKSVKEEIDLAIIAVPAQIVPTVVEECCEKKVSGIVVISAGFSEVGSQGKVLQEKIKKMAEKANIPLIGPNCLGVIRPSVSLNASFAPSTPKAGGIAFVSQSGALLDSVIDRSEIENYGFSTIISSGNQAVLSVSDYLEWLEKDNETRVICLYIEGIKDGKRFMETAKRISRKKPILVVKGGKTEMSRKAISSHTASLAGDYLVFQTAFKQSNIIEVETIEELFSKAKAIDWQPRCKNKVAVLTNGGGAGVLLSDYLNDVGVELAFPPVDIIGDATSEDYRKNIEKVLKNKKTSALLVVQTVQIMTEVEKNAKIIIDIKKNWPNKPVLCSFLGGASVKKAISILEKNKVPNYNDLKKMAQAISSLIN